MTGNNGQLKAIIERLERINEEKAAARDDFNEVLKEAKGNGYDQGAIRRLIRKRSADPAKLAEAEALDDMYAAEVGGV